MDIDTSLSALFQEGCWVTTTSGLTAIQVALRCAGIGPGSIVACDPILPYAALATLSLHALPVFYECSTTHPLDPKVKDIGQHATILTSYFGRDPTVDVPDGCGKIILDRSQCFGPNAYRQSCYATTYSFQSGKFVDCGHGGAICFYGRDEAHKAIQYISLGWRRNRNDSVDWRIDPTERSLGISARMSPILESHIITHSKSYFQKAELIKESLYTYWENSDIRSSSYWKQLPSWPWKIPLCEDSHRLANCIDHLELQPRTYARYWDCFKPYSSTEPPNENMMMNPIVCCTPDL